MALAAYAAHPHNSRGRTHAEPPPGLRSKYQRDRDRIVHCSAFRRLEYKTQVFVNHEGDLYRTRLTHTLEVAQIARTMARALDVNEDLCEAIALAHDLGHTPFGHAGQDALDHCMRDYGGFEHNLQSLRVVDKLERHYADFAGLNLTFETREGILKHCTRTRAARLGALGERFLHGWQPGLEAQIANLADEIAYNNHDVDDGLRAGLLDMDQLRQLSLFEDHYREVRRRYPDLRAKQIRYEVIRRMVNHLVTDAVLTSRRRIAEVQPADIDAVRRSPQPLIAFSADVARANAELKRFLFRNLYRHYRVHRMNVKTQRVVSGLFGAFFADPLLLPPRARGAEGDCTARTARRVADYVAGMTDRFALAEWGRLGDANLPG